MRKITITLTLFFNTLLCLNGQFLSNPSFEGTKGMGVVPPSWSVCELHSTPDTQPGAFGSTESPTHGNCFLSLVGRGIPAPSAGFVEDVETVLKKPLLKGKCYRFKIDLAMSTSLFVDDFGTIYMFNNPLIFRLYGSDAACSKQDVLLDSPPVNHGNWKNYEVIITPKFDITHLRIHPAFVNGDHYFGSMLLDNIQLSEVMSPDVSTKDTLVTMGSIITLNASEATNYSWAPDSLLSCVNCASPTATILSECTFTVVLQKQGACESFMEVINVRVITANDLFIPNVITPNGDGFNDSFKIKSLPPQSKLTIVNRLGEVLFETNNYKNDWDGKFKGNLLEPDTYWYTLTFDVTQKPIVGFVYLKQTE